jgi:hypothetical protein
MLIALRLLLNKWSTCTVWYPDSTNLIRRSFHSPFCMTKGLSGSTATTLLSTEIRPSSTVSTLRVLILKARRVKISGRVLYSHRMFTTSLVRYTSRDSVQLLINCLILYPININYNNQTSKFYFSRRKKVLKPRASRVSEKLSCFLDRTVDESAPTKGIPTYIPDLWSDTFRKTPLGCQSTARSFILATLITTIRPGKEENY